MTKTLIAFCLMAAAARSEPLEVWCGVPPLTTVVQTIGGERVAAHSFMSGAQDPCVYSPTPRAVARAQQAGLFVTAGMPFETIVAERLQTLNPNLTVLDTSQGIADNGDPHIWMSLKNLSCIAGEIVQTLSRLDPGGAALYQQNGSDFQQRLARLHGELTARLEPVRGVIFYAYHPILGHFADDYGLIQQTVELDGKSPTPKQLLGLINRAREEQVRVIFVQPQFSQRPSRILADRIGGQVIAVNPLADDPVSVIEQAAATLAEFYATRPNP